MTENQERIVEPLAKFHAKVSTKGRVAIPKETRALYEIQYNDFVILSVRKVDTKAKRPIKRALMLGKVSTSGQTVIPKQLQEDLGIHVGEIVEIALMGVIKTRQFLLRLKLPQKYLEWLLKRGFILIDEETEKSLLAELSHNPYMGHM